MSGVRWREFLPFDAPLAAYVRQADELFTGWQSGDAGAIGIFRTKHPKFLDDKIPWLERRMTDEDVRATPIDRDDAAMALARAYDFRDWAALEQWVSEVTVAGSPVWRFENAADAIVTGDAVRLRRLLSEDPELVHARSTRVTHFDPPVHRATLLHYLAANGVEGYRQRSPANAVEIAVILLDAGADPNALQGSYGSENTTMAMLVSSEPPRTAGVLLGILHALIDRGASVAPLGTGHCADPVMTALIFGNADAALALEQRGANVSTLPAAAALGRIDVVTRLLPLASSAERHRALALAAQHGRTDVVRVLLDAGEDPDRYNPEGYHAHATPLHQSIANGRFETAKLLIERGARIDIKDRIYQSTAMGWAEYCNQPAIAELIRGS